jgi:hypothetical protein
MASRRDAAANAAADLVTRKQQEMDAYREHRDRIAQCRDEAFNEKREANRQASMQRAMNDPDFMRQTAELSQRVMEAQQKGDTAEMMRLNLQAAALLEGPTRADTLAWTATAGSRQGLRHAGAVHCCWHSRIPSTPRCSVAPRRPTPPGSGRAG